MVPPQVGRLLATGDHWEPYRLTDPAGTPVEAVSAWFCELQAAGRSAATTRSYGMDLLRWFRLLWAAGVAWDRATRAEARDFCRWLQVAAQPSRVHWRHRDEVTGAPLAAAPAKAYAPSVRAHSETVLRGFYDFHREDGTGPILNPFPLDRARTTRRANAHHNPMEPHRNERTGDHRGVGPG